MTLQYIYIKRALAAAVPIASQPIYFPIISISQLNGLSCTYLNSIQSVNKRNDFKIRRKRSRFRGNDGNRSLFGENDVHSFFSIFFRAFSFSHAQQILSPFFLSLNLYLSTISRLKFFATPKWHSILHVSSVHVDVDAKADDGVAAAADAFQFFAFAELKS